MSPQHRQRVRLAIALVVTGAASVGARLWLAAAVGLAPDEAYYFDWSRELAPGYLDHPPAVAWLIAATTAVVGDSPVGVRLPAVLLGGMLLPALTYWLAREAGASARFALLLPLASILQPLGVAGGLIITPDVPLLIGWTAAAAATLRALRSDAGRWWLAAGLATGLTLLSKHSGWLLLVSVALAALADGRGRRQLRGRWPWTALALALSLAAPNLWWDAARGWSSLGFQLEHGLGPSSLWMAPLRLLELIGGQVGLLTPVVAWGAGWFLLGAEGEDERRLRVLALVPLTVFAGASLLSPPEANWPAPAHPLLLAGVVARLERELGVAGPERRRRLRRWAGAAVGTSAVITALALVHLLSPLPWLPAEREPAARLRAWNDLPSSLAAADAPLLAEDYELAAAVSYHLPGRPEVTVRCPTAGRCPPGALGLASTPGRQRPSPPPWLARPGSRPVEVEVHPMRRGDGDVVRTLGLFRLVRRGSKTRHGLHLPGTGE